MIRLRTAAPLTFALLLAGSARAQERKTQPLFERQVLAMGTRLSFQFPGASGEQGDKASEAALKECNRIETACSTWRPDSAFSRLNASAGATAQLPAEWLGLLQIAQGWSHRTGGAFDPVLFRLLAAYGVREGGRHPSEQELTQARASSGARLLLLNGRRGTARLKDGAGIEEGGFLKGYVLDRMKKQIIHQGVSSGCLDFGGQLLTFGKAMIVPIADPKDRGLPRFSIPLAPGSLASSGLSEHGRHIVDPRTGLLCEDWGSVSVIASSGLEADCLSTALYVMGPVQGLAWARRHHVPALFLLNDGRVRMSPSFAALHPTSLSPE